KGVNLAAVCGLFCGECENLGIKCRGCVQKGKPFWTTVMKIEGCPLYICCVEKKNLEHCGLCAELPCKTFNELHDPSLDDEEAQKALVARRNELIKRKQIGTQKWLRKKMA
ncbi:DUF3795 domain-containing protein, partial [Candidatus Bathyarchaeota archaeon]